MAAMVAPTRLTLHTQTQALEIAFDDGASFRLPFEFLRVHSPSAEVKGHGPGQATLQTGKRGVCITALPLVGHYGVQPQFSDGHSSGIYSWAYLYDLGRRQEALWADYLRQLAAAGGSRDPEPHGGGDQR
ncbi:MAG TPA: DUF971 domain-containing protein [Burkholderiaceae bacterium]|nr:DUF971 domain-containing protein [Burkholderiaceae bacterium]